MNKQCHGQYFNLSLKPSSLAIAWLVFTHLTAIVMILISAWSVSFKVLFACVLLVGCYFNYRKLTNPAQLHKQLRFSVECGWQIKNAKDNIDAVLILPTTWLCEWLIVLHFQLGNSRCVWPIFCDEVHANEFRRLKVLLKSHGLTTKF